MNSSKAALISVLILLNTGMTHAAMIASQDKYGSKDHPLVSRYPGSFIYDYHVSDYDEYQHITGSVSNGKLQSKRVEGKYTSITYALPDKLTTFQVFSNYQQAFNAAGVKQVLSCTQSTCGEYLPKKFVESLGGDKVMRYLGVDMYNTGTNSDYRFWTGVLEHNNKKSYITFMVTKSVAGINAFIDIVEAKSMATGLVKLDLKSMDQSISTHGRVVLSGLYFDTDKATLKPKSKQSMETIARYLKKFPKKKFYVTGHTDSVGSYDHNLQLSRQRAAAVVHVLNKDYGINLNRLTAAGVGPVSPIAGNVTEDGRRKNRRVELVSQ